MSDTAFRVQSLTRLLNNEVLVNIGSVYDLVPKENEAGWLTSVSFKVNAIGNSGAATIEIEFFVGAGGLNFKYPPFNSNNGVIANQISGRCENYRSRITQCFD